VRVPRPVLAIAGIVIVAGLAGVWYLFFRPAGPPPVTGASPVPGASAPLTSSPASSRAPGASGAIAGTWTIDASAGSFVGYRVQETLASIGAATAVGRTTGVAGSLVLDGATITSVQITADLTGLQSDESRRDGQLRRQALETDRFPTATFTLTSPIDLGSVPGDGQSVSATATGDLTLHGVTRSVQIEVQAARSGDAVTVSGSIEIQFVDFDMTPPSSFVVLSVADHGTMELQLVFRKG